jgi:hypothetical protein
MASLYEFRTNCLVWPRFFFFFLILKPLRWTVTNPFYFARKSYVIQRLLYILHYILTKAITALNLTLCFTNSNTACKKSDRYAYYIKNHQNMYWNNEQFEFKPTYIWKASKYTFYWNIEKKKTSNSFYYCCYKLQSNQIK